MFLQSVLIAALLGLSSQQISGPLRRVCYYTNWSQYRPGSGKFLPENVDPTLCTHYVYAFATLQGNQVKAFEWNDESTPWSKGMYERFMALKSQNPAMKVLLAVGGWNMGSGPFTAMVATPQSRSEFITSAIAFLRKNGFDGLDVDWEYPANRGSPPADRDRFTDLIREVRSAFESEAASSGRPRLLVSSAVAAGKSNIDTAYNIPELNRYLDFISLMTYDLHGSWETFTGHHTALYPRASDTGDQSYLNLDFAANYWVQKGASRDKLNIGLATYARTFTLANLGQNDLGAQTRAAGNAGQETRENGFLAYYEVCRMLKSGAQSHFDQEQFVTYVTNGDQWAGGEDAHSLAQKVCYIKQHGFGGVMVWAIDLDDFSGNECGQGPYPLMHAIVNEMNNPSTANCPTPNSQHQQPPQNPWQGYLLTTPGFPGVLPWSTQTLPPLNPGFQGVFWNTPSVGQTPSPTTPAPYVFFTQTPQPTVGPQYTQGPQSTPGSGNPYMTPVMQQLFNCMNLPSDFYPNPLACDEYYICANQVTWRVRCAMGLQYNPSTKFCDWPANVHCVNLHSGGAGGTAPQTLPPQAQTTPPPLTWPRPQPPVQASAGPQLTSADAFCGTMADGAYKNPSDCNSFFVCSQRRGSLGSCPQGLAFNDALKMCQDPYYVPACRTLAG